MIEIFSSDIEYVCKRMQRTLDDSNGIVNSTDYNFLKHQEIERYKYDDGNPFAILSTIFYSAARIFDFCVSFDTYWYENATKSQLQLISNLTLNIKNLEVGSPIFLYTYTFRNEIENSLISTSPLAVKYENCVLTGNKERYQPGRLVTFENCVFTGD